MILEIEKLRRDGGTQFRKGLDPEVIEDYAVKIGRGEKFPEPVAFYDGSDYWLADGFQTTAANEKLGRTEIDVDVKTGTRRDAVLYAATDANRNHGQPFTREEKRARVKALLDDPEWCGWSNVMIAEKCGVDEKMVRRMRPADESANLGSAEVGEGEAGSGKQTAPQKRTGRDGKARAVPAKKGKRQLLDPESEIGKMLAEKPLPPAREVEASGDEAMDAVLGVAREIGRADGAAGSNHRTVDGILAGMKGRAELPADLRRQIKGDSDLSECLLEAYVDGYVQTQAAQPAGGDTAQDARDKQAEAPAGAAAGAVALAAVSRERDEWMRRAQEAEARVGQLEEEVHDLRNDLTKARLLLARYERKGQQAQQPEAPAPDELLEPATPTASADTEVATESESAQVPGEDLPPDAEVPAEPVVVYEDETAPVTQQAGSSKRKKGK